MFQKATVATILKEAEKKSKKTANPTLIEELFLAALLKEMEGSQKTRVLFSAFYREIVKPMMFIQSRNKVVWWACNWVFNREEEFKRLDCSHLKAFFSTNPKLRVDTFTGRHDGFANENQDGGLNSQVLINYIDELCAKEVEFSASEYLAMWRAASAEKIRSAKINQIKVRYDQTQNIDAFFTGMAEIEREYRKALEPAKTNESKSIAELDIDKLTAIVTSTTPENHFIPTAETELNRQIFGFPRGGLSLITGVSGGGKSLHILRYAYNAFKAGYKVLYLSLEMTEQRILRELMTIGGGIPNSAIESATTEAEMNDLSLMFLERAKADAKHKGALYYDIAIDVELVDLLDIVRVHASSLDVDMVCIDLFDEISIPQELQANPNGKGGYFETMLRQFIELGREYDMAITGAVQLKADAVLNGRIQQEAIGGSIWYAKKSSLILFSHRSTDELPFDEYNYKPLYAIEVLKDRESGKGAKGFQCVRYIDRDTKETHPAPFKNMAQVEKRIAKEQKDSDSQY